MNHRRLNANSTPATILADMISDIESEIASRTSTIESYQSEVSELGVKKVFLKRLIDEAKQADVRREIEAEVLRQRAAAECGPQEPGR